MEISIMSMTMRLDKYLANQEVGSRSQVKTAIRKGLVKIGEEVAKQPEEKVVPGVDRIYYDGREVLYQQYEYLMLNKPSGYVSATTDKKDKTVIELLQGQGKKEIFPVGRLDKDTEGLLLLTNDGALAHQLLSPKKHVEKKYYALVEGKVTKEDQKQFLEGVDIGEKKKTLPASLHILESGEQSKITLSICEGKFHQVKRMFQAVDKEVIYLKRLSMGSLTLDETLALGEYRSLTNEEIEGLKKGTVC